MEKRIRCVRACVCACVCVCVARLFLHFLKFLQWYYYFCNYKKTHMHTKETRLFLNDLLKKKKEEEEDSMKHSWFLCEIRDASLVINLSPPVEQAATSCTRQPCIKATASTCQAGMGAGEKPQGPAPLLWGFHLKSDLLSWKTHHNMYQGRSGWRAVMLMLPGGLEMQRDVCSFFCVYFVGFN